MRDTHLPCESTPVTLPDSDCKNCVSDVRVNGESVVEDGIANINSVGGDKNFVYEQQTAARTWDITHNLDKMPSITVIDSAGTVVQGEYEEVNRNRVILYFSAPFSGKAIMN